MEENKVLDFVLYKAKKNAELFLDDMYENDYRRINAIMNPDNINSLTLYLMLMNEKLDGYSTLTQLNEASKALSDKGVKHNINAEFDKDDQNETIKEFLNLVEGVDGYLNDCTEIMCDLHEKIKSSFTLLTGMSLGSVFSIPEINNRAEKLYLDMKKSKNFEKLFNYVVTSMVDLALDSSSTAGDDFEQVANKNVGILKSYLNDKHISLYETYVLYDKILLRAIGNVARLGRFMAEICNDNLDIPENEHCMYIIENKSLDKLFKAFDENDKKVMPDLGAHDGRKFTNRLIGIKNRRDYVSGEETLIDSSEIENEMLFNIITEAPHQLETFVKFLIDEKIKLPLAGDRINFYLADLASKFDNRTISRAFIEEHGTGLPDIDKFRSANGITSEMISFVKAKKPKKSNDKTQDNARVLTKRPPRE